MYEMSIYKFILNRNQSEEETPDDQEAFYWFFYESPNVGYDIFESSSIDGAVSQFREKYKRHINEINDWHANDDGSHGHISISNSFDGLEVTFSIERV
ncbi:hypothetical protein POF51_29545 [Brevibacillus sp. AG]|uniref:hypothetical protein n=1 Tax=Brevibacillus sp. AG TaxID=3020891 RepID=UPI0023305172|nr:hypothetical protein [Brevibacillus sp. AG]MDC0764869.1 hypothetical protein [Brevibacillus sp. AG]